MQTLENMMDESSVCHTKLLHHISSKQKLGFDTRTEGNKSTLYLMIEKICLFSVQYVISFDHKNECECITEEKGQTCLMKAIEMYRDKVIKNKRHFQTQYIMVMQMIFMKYYMEMMISKPEFVYHRDLRGMNVLFTFLFYFENKQDIALIGNIVQQLFRFYDKHPQHFSWEDSYEDKNLRSIFLERGWMAHVILTDSQQESLYQMDMKIPANQKLLFQMIEKTEFVEKCIQQIVEDEEITRFEYVDEENRSFMHLMAIDSQYEDTAIQFLEDPKFFYFAYPKDNLAKHIVIETLRRENYRFVIAFLKKMAKTPDWKEFLSILLHEDMDFYLTISEEFSSKDTREEILPVLEILEFVYSHDSKKNGIEHLDSSTLMSLTIQEHEDKRIIDIDIFNRIFIFEELKDEKIEFNDQMILFFEYLMNSSGLNSQDEILQVFKRMVSLLNVNDYFTFLKVISENERWIQYVLTIPTFRKHAFGMIRKLKKHETTIVHLDDNCPICLNTLETKHFSCSKCKQPAHVECLRDWIHHNPSCVMCRNKFNLTDVKYINSSLKKEFYTHLHDTYLKKE